MKPPTLAHLISLRRVYSVFMVVTGLALVWGNDRFMWWVVLLNFLLWLLTFGQLQSEIAAARQKPTAGGMPMK